MRELGLANDELVERQVEYLKWHLGNDVGRRWWAQYQLDESDNELLDAIDAALQGHDFDQNRDFPDAVFRDREARR